MPDEDEHRAEPDHLLRLTTTIISGYVAGNHAPADRVAPLVGEVHLALARLCREPAAAPTQARRPSVPVSRSVQPDYLVCLEDGKRLKMLKRYLRARYAMTPEDYRRKWGLSPDYPMVAPNYAAKRSDFAKRIGLGRRRRA